MASSSPHIKLFRGFENAPCYAWSPFVCKLEARLRFSGVAYEREVGSPLKGPRRKIPYVHVSSEGQSKPAILGDSDLIIDHLIKTGAATDLNVQLSPVDRANDFALRSLLEDRSYFHQLYERWVQNFYAMRAGIFGNLPYPVQVLAGLVAYRFVSQALDGQGTGRFTSEELAAFRSELYDNVNAMLVDAKKSASPDGAPFWLFKGQDPTEADATLFGFIVSSLVCPAAPETSALLKTYPEIMDYTRRIHERFFPEYDSWQA